MSWQSSTLSCSLVLALVASPAMSRDSVSVGTSPITASPLDCVIIPSVVADLGSGTPGVLSQIAVDRADFVRAGDVVAQLESGVEVAARDLARVRAAKDTEIELRRVNAAFGHRQHERSRDLFKRKVISTNDMDERKTEAQVARIQLRQAQDNKELAALELQRAEQVLKRRTINSPISGVVMERFKTIGEYVDEQPVLRVAQLDPLHVEVFVPVDQLGEVRPGMRAEVWSEAVAGSSWQARVNRVDRVADIASGTYGVNLVLPNSDYQVPAGLRCQLRFQAADASDPVVPAQAAVDARAADKQQASARPIQPPPVVAAPIAAQPHELSAAPEAVSPQDRGEPVPDASETASVCRRIGPFAKRAAAEAVAAELRKEGLDARVESAAPARPLRYRVVSLPLSSRAEAKAMVARLNQAGISDFYLPPKKRPPLRVSLGLFASKANAEQRVRALAELQVDAQLQPRQVGADGFSLSVFGTATRDAREQLDRLPAVPDLPGHCSQLASG